MANKKRNVYKPKPMTAGKRSLIQGLLQEYEIESAEDIQDALKDLLSGTIQGMLDTVPECREEMARELGCHYSHLQIFSGGQKGILYHKCD